MTQNKKAVTIKAICIAAYTTVGFLTFGYGINRFPDFRPDSGDRFFVAAAAGSLWPIYWAGHFSIAITKP